jgi:hypothetical protein
MAWLKMRVELWTHPKVSLLAKRQGVSKATVIGGLHGLWAIADTHSDDGFVASLTGEMIDAQIELEGFAEAVAGVGWLELSDEGARFPNFEAHNSQTAKARAQTQKRVQRNRNGAVTHDRNASVTREEESKGEETREESKPAAAAAEGGGKERSKSEKFDPLTAELPTALATPAFKAAWADWCSHLREKKKPLTPTACKQQLAKLSAMGQQRAIAALKHSTASNYCGVYEPDAPRSTNGQSRTSGNLDQLKSFLEQNGEHDHGSPIIDSESSNGDFPRLESANGRRPA